MNVVWIDDAVTYEKKRHKVRVTIYNYTPQGAEVQPPHGPAPGQARLHWAAACSPTEVKDDGKITWELRSIPIHRRRWRYQFDLKGLDQEAYEENEIYVSGIDPALVIGADPLPGDWDVKALQISECRLGGTGRGGRGRGRL